MKIKKYAVAFMLFSTLAILCCCGNTTAKTIIEMELTSNYDTSDPFINEKLFYVSNDIDTLVLDTSVQIQGESGLLEIADNETDEVFWSDTWNGGIEETKFTILLDNLDSEKEYVVRFIGTKIDYAKIVITSESSLIKEREKPQKPDRG